MNNNPFYSGQKIAYFNSNRHPLFFRNNNFEQNNIVPIAFKEHSQNQNNFNSNAENVASNKKPQSTQNDVVMNQLNQLIEIKKKHQIPAPTTTQDDDNTKPILKKNIPRNPFQKTQITSIQNLKFSKPISSLPDNKENIIKKYKTNNTPLHEFNPIASSVREYSYNEEKNYPNRKEMQDFHKIIDRYLNEDTNGYFSLFDGHGGCEYVKYASERLPEIFAKNLKETEYNFESSFVSSFKEIDNELKQYFPETENSGSTLTLIIICYETHQVFGRKKVLYCSNVGDSKCVVVTADKKFKQISTEHKCTDKFELDRIKGKDGIVFGGRMFGQLALSRALGDFSLKPYGLTATPSIYKRTLTENDKFVIIASDGVWDVITEEEIVDICFEKEEEDTDKIGKKIISTALKKGSCDNMSCITIKL